MQQYYTVDEGSGTLTVFHTEDKVSFDMEFYGGYSVQSEKLLSFLTDDSRTSLEVEQDERKRGSVKNEQVKIGTITKDSDGSLEVSIDTSKVSSDKRPVTAVLTPDQTQTLIDSITLGDVERYDDGSYPVETVWRDGVQKR